MIEIKQKNEQNILYIKEVQNVPLLSFSLLENVDSVINGFSTRIGGVSTGEFSSMNFITARGDSQEAVRENYKRIARVLGVELHRMTASYQTHTTNIRVVTKADEGKGIVRDRDYTDIDGMITNTPGITLVTFYADCVPLYFVDPKKKAIGLSHSGWRGTVNGMAAKTVEAMQKNFGSDPEDILACVGPSICKDCYEISQDVAEAFQKAFTNAACDEFLEKKGNGKYQLDLWKANEILLSNAGILREHMAITNICTCCNADILFSHRASKGRRGNLAAFLCLKEEA